MMTVYIYDGNLFDRGQYDDCIGFQANNMEKATELINLALKNGYSVYIVKNEK